MMKVLLGRLLPIGAAAGLLASSASPVRPALDAFAHAANALGGSQNEDTSGLAMPDEASVKDALGSATTGGFSLKKMFGSLFGPSESDKSKAQLAQIIASVKGRSATGTPGIPVDGLPTTGKAGTKTGAKTGKLVAGKTGAKGAAPAKAPPKGTTAPPTPNTEPAAPAAPATGEGRAAADEGGGEGAAP